MGKDTEKVDVIIFGAGPAGLAAATKLLKNKKKVIVFEKEDQVGQKVKNLVEQNITPVLCISDINQMDNYLAANENFKQNASKIVFVYEPPSAISGGGDYHPESPEEASLNAAKISEKIGSEVVTLYGGSVSEADVDKFLAQKNINGVLVGKASLTAETFIQLVQKANNLVL